LASVPAASVRQRSPRAERAKIRTHEALFALIASDVLVALGSSLVIFADYGHRLGYSWQQLWFGLASFLLAWPFSAYMQHLYARATMRSDLRQLLLRTFATWALTFGLLLLCGFALNVIGSVSRIWLVSWATTVLVWTGLARVAWRAYLHHRLRLGDCFERTVVLAGSVRAAHRLSETVERESRGHLRVAAAAALAQPHDTSAFDWLEDMVRRGAVDRVVIGSFAGAVAETNALLARLTRLAIDVTLLPELDHVQAPLLHVERIGMLPAVELDFRPLTQVQTYLKRAEDLVLAFGLTVFLLPVLATIALAIRLDSGGPVLFRQDRAGFNGRTFKVWKFRTMHVHLADHGAVRQTSRGDRRVTRVGRFLRRTSLDELPQLFNVLAGDMSIVGPRPHALGMTTVGMPVHEALEEYTARHRLKPGITGWAQVNGSRGEVDTLEKLQRRVALDCHYIENWSLGFDLWIIARTALLVAFDPNAY
jgi:Undecaprenyl-phosphate glucose phosphotransferase